MIHTITIGSDAAGGTVTIRDGSASGTVLFKAVQPANAAAFNAVLDAVYSTGLWLVTSGFAAPAVTVTFK